MKVLTGVYGTSYPRLEWERYDLPTVSKCDEMVLWENQMYSISYDSLVVFSWDDYWKKWKILYAEEGTFNGLAEDTIYNQVWAERGFPYYLQKTSDGKNWEKIEIDENVKASMGGKAYFLFKENLIFVGHYGHTENNCLIFSKDNGKTWKKDGSLYGSIKGMGIFCDYLYVATDIGLFRKKL